MPCPPEDQKDPSSGPTNLSQQELEPRIIRVLCIHGFRQNPTQFHGRTRALQKRLKQYLSRETGGAVNCELCFDACGPHMLPPYLGEAAETMHMDTLHDNRRPKRAWLLTPDQYYGKTGWLESKTSLEQQYLLQTCGWDESQTVLDTILDSNSYDAVMGFSQGASVAAYVAMKESVSARRFMCAIIISGYQLHLMDEFRDDFAASIPSLHIYGEVAKDLQIPPSESRALADRFDSSMRQEIQTSDGHLVPSSREHVATIGSFLLQHCTI